MYDWMIDRDCSDCGERIEYEDAWVGDDSMRCSKCTSPKWKKFDNNDETTWPKDDSEFCFHWNSSVWSDLY